MNDKAIVRRNYLDLATGQLHYRVAGDRARVTITGVVDPDECAVGMCGLVLQIEKGRVHGRELLHIPGLVLCQCEDTG